MYYSDEFELSRVELKRFQAESSRTGAFKFSIWNQADNIYVNKQQIFQSWACIMIIINFMSIFMNFCKTIGIFGVEH